MKRLDQTYNRLMKKLNTYTLRIKGSHPNKLPLDRLALYLAELAKLMGEKELVHLDRVAVGSAALRAWAEPEAAPAVSERVSLAVSNSDDADQEATKALSRINELLSQDGKKGELKNPAGAVIYPFPGSKKNRPDKELIIDQESTVTGRVIKIGGRDDTIPLLLKDSDGTEYRCTVKGEDLAREISSYYLGDPIEVTGKGRWRRTHEGRWILENLIVTAWTALSTDWDAAYDLMGKLASGWRDVADIEERCAEIRKGH
ncbi:hypothetical protein [Pseudomonas sp. BC115LW]|uniref:hypothetical protein n=1 Tax=Pseudomonas sp. BC115LW TaxID=2683267 RepID=UPI0021142492|nr:hypothetical protein [Pseudomonas sp. BC115LW]